MKGAGWWWGIRSKGEGEGETRRAPSPVFVAQSPIGRVGVIAQRCAIGARISLSGRRLGSTGEHPRVTSSRSASDRAESRARVGRQARASQTRHTRPSRRGARRVPAHRSASPDACPPARTEPNQSNPMGPTLTSPHRPSNVPRPRPASLTRPVPHPARSLLNSRTATRHARWACPPEASTPPRFGRPRAGGSPTRKRGSETRSWVSRSSASPARSSSTTHGRWSSAPSRPRDASRPRRGVKTSRRGPRQVKTRRRGRVGTAVRGDGANARAGKEAKANARGCAGARADAPSTRRIPGG